MKPILTKILKTEVIYLFVLFCFLMISLQSCKTEKKENTEEPVTTKTVEKDFTIDIATFNMDFQMQDTIPSGWNTFRYKNASPQTHFFLVDKYPEGKGSEEAEKIIGPIFDRGMKLIMEGKPEEGFAVFGELPEWFSQVKFMGGSGLTSPGQVAVTTLRLEPGKYMLECYVKMANGMFHTSMGMTKDLVVSEESTGMKAPVADIPIDISSTEGISFIPPTKSGLYTFSVFYKDQIAHENFVGHDVNLVKIHEGANMDDLESWMNWADPKGLIEPAPKDFTFLGGVNDMPEGSMGYFTVNLEAGNYALISEVPAPSSKNLLKRFTITE